MAPPKRSSFSVSVVLSASGCEMIAKVRRRATGLGSVIIFELWGRSALYLVRLRPQGKPGDDSCVPMRLARHRSGLLRPGGDRAEWTPADCLTAELLKANSCAPIVLSDRAGMGYELNLDALAKAWVK